jgi:predicted small lipoprotein YifL
MRRLLLPLALASATAAALSGCGQKGPLYLPPPTPAGSTVTSGQPAHASTVHSPAPASTTRTPFNPVIHQ